MGMGLPLGLDIDVLRSFVIIAEEKSFTRAADRVGRTQSAVSLQMQRLESLLGHTVLTRGKGGSVELNQQGLYLLGRARELLDLNDDIVKSVRAAPVHGTLRFGVAEEIASHYLPRILEQFMQVAPSVEVQLIFAVSCALGIKLKNNELDLAIIEGGVEPRQWPAVEVWRSPLQWITSDIHNQHLQDPLPVSLSPDECPWRPSWMQECLWRGMATRALDQASRKFRVVSTSGSTAGQLATAQAGLTVVASLATNGLPSGLRAVRADEGLPELPITRFLLMKAKSPRQPVTDLLAAQVLDVFGLEQVILR